ncbi:MAG: hypothetical protein JWM85_472 [Acidimicrobiaceae bacterium]|nr:hypothetical protein [Acidimicrobiaceae bacterium]
MRQTLEMATVDPNQDIEVVEGPDSLTAFVPLAEASGPWVGEYVALARAARAAGAVRAEVRDSPRNPILIVQVPLGASEQETSKILDLALELVDKAKAAAADRASANGAGEQHILRWWRERGSQTSS